MRPFTALLGFVAGSLVSMAFALLVVLMVFWWLRNDHPRFAAELPQVALGSFIFVVLAVLSGIAFWATVCDRRWRYASLGLLWIGLVLVGFYYWPS